MRVESEEPLNPSAGLGPFLSRQLSQPRSPPPTLISLKALSPGELSTIRAYPLEQSLDSLRSTDLQLSFKSPPSLLPSPLPVSRSTIWVQLPKTRDGWLVVQIRT